MITRKKINEFLAEHDSYNIAYSCKLSKRIAGFCNGHPVDCKEDCKIHAEPITRDYCNEISVSTNLAIAKGFRIEVYIGKESVGVKIGSENLNVLTVDFKGVTETEAYARALVLYKCLGGEE